MDKKNQSYRPLKHEEKMKKLSGLSSALSRLKVDYERAGIRLFKSGYMEEKDVEGININFINNMMIVKYHFFCNTEELKKGKVKDEVETRFSSIVSGLKKHYKDIVGEAISLKKKGDIDVLIQAGSLKRVFAIATCVYEIGEADDWEG